MEAGRISFCPRAIYDVLLSPKNLQLWVGEDSLCPLCSSPATLRHILTGCKVRLCILRQIHLEAHQVLKCLAAAIESKRTAINAPPLMTPSTARAVEQEWRRTSPLTKTGQWRELGGSVGQRLTVPAKIVTTTLWSNTLQRLPQRRQMRGRGYGMQGWQTMLISRAGKLQSTLWRLAAGALCQHLPKSCIRSWESMDNPCARPSEKWKILQNIAVDGCG